MSKLRSTTWLPLRRKPLPTSPLYLLCANTVAFSSAHDPPQVKGLEFLKQPSWATVGKAKRQPWVWQKLDPFSLPNESQQHAAHSSGETTTRCFPSFGLSNFRELNRNADTLRHKQDLGHIHPRTLPWPSTGSEGASTGQITQTNAIRGQTAHSNKKWRRGVRALFLYYFQSIHLPLARDLKSSELIPDIIKKRLEQLFIKKIKPEQIKALALVGYSIDDFIAWSWIVTATDADAAVQRLTSFSERIRMRKSNRSTKPLIPTFIPLQILRSEHLNPWSIKLLLEDAKTRIPPEQYEKTKANVSWLVYDLDLATLLIVRLFRHARLVAPELYPEIASLATTLIRKGLTARRLQSQSNPAEVQKLSFCYNRILSIISLPTAVHPFKTVQIRQEAQFQILRRMLDFRPHLPVSREGYHALVATQLARRKSEEESRWAKVKSPSWPPWREHKMGIDADTQYSGSQSRALSFLNRMVEAGYGFSDWDYAAQILAGWDTDNSPTIQTRSLVNGGRQYWNHLQTTGVENSLEIKPRFGPRTWAARVQATRTIREAWACFCSFKAESDAMGGFLVYMAMFRKLLAPVGNNEDGSLPGDGKEILPEPVSPQNFLYTPTDPPSVDELYKKMLADGIKPAGRLLADLLEGCDSLNKGFKYIRDSTLREATKAALLSAEEYSEGSLFLELTAVQDYLFAAFLRLLLRATREDETIKVHRPSSALGSTGKEGRIEIKPASYAFRLLVISESRYIPAWLAFFEKISPPPNIQQRRAEKITADQAWRRRQSMSKLLVFAERRGVTTSGAVLDHILRFASTTCLSVPPLGSNSSILSKAKSYFAASVMPGQAPTSKWLDVDSEPAFISAPSPLSLSLMVKLCAITQDIAGLMSLLRWMSRYERELASGGFDSTSDMKLMQQTRIVLKVFLEGTWATPEDLSNGLVRAADEEQIQEAKVLVESQQSSQAWPEFLEVKEYLESRQGWVNRIRRAALAQAQARGQVVTPQMADDAKESDEYE